MLGLTGQDLCYHKEKPLPRWPSGKADTKNGHKETPFNCTQERLDTIHLGNVLAEPQVLFCVVFFFFFFYCKEA